MVCLVYTNLFKFDGETSNVCLCKSRSNPFREPTSTSNEGKVSCSWKQRGPLLGLELTTDRHPPTTSQTGYPLRHIAPFVVYTVRFAVYTAWFAVYIAQFAIYIVRLVVYTVRFAVYTAWFAVYTARFAMIIYIAQFAVYIAY